jgi:carboxyl-terminal processing protease
MSSRVQLTVTALCALAVGVGVAHFVDGFFADSPSTVASPSDSNDFDPAQSQPLMEPAALVSATATEQEMARRLAEVIGKIRREYVDEVPTEEWLERTLRSLVSSLDKHSAYLDAREHEAVLRNVAGHYPGVGIEVVAQNERIKILRILSESPAERAGLRAGDEILSIDGEPVAANAVSAIAQMRGPVGTRVGMTVRRAAENELVELTLERTQVDVKSVSAQSLADGLGYLRIHAFSDTTPIDFLDAVAELKSAATDLRGVVLDLRSNPGGVLESAAAVADALLEEGVIVTAEGRAAESIFEMKAEPGDVLQGIPLMVLINQSSASAAEILAGALQDHGRATLLGRRTYGKGSVQSVIPLAAGRAIKLTTSRYATPSGRQIQTEGIEPDILFEEADTLGQSPEWDSTVQAALAELRRGTLSKRTRTADTRLPRG